MPTVEQSGQQLTIIGTEHTLATIITNRSLLMRVDLNPLPNGATVILRVYERVLVGGVDRLTFARAFTAPFPDRGTVSVPISSPHQAVFTLEQTQGAVQTYDWSVESL